VQIAFQGSPKATVDFRRIMLKRLTHTGSTLRARSVADKGAIARAVEEHVLPLIAAGRVSPVIDSTFALAEASAAHARMETSAHIGKIVLTMASRWNYCLFSLVRRTGGGRFTGLSRRVGPRNRRKST
jgi:NADPH2:quinone reductase